MLFNSIHFLIFLPVVFLFHWLLPERYRKPFLLVASYYFYMSWNPWFGLLLAGTTIIDWFIALQIDKSKYNISSLKFKFNSQGEIQKTRSGKIWLIVSIFSNLGILAGFKYAAFLYNTFSFSGSLFSGNSPHYMEAIVIPVGLSFYTFHSLGYVIDVYRGKIEAEKELPIFALFVSFFPQLVAGPIARFGDLGVQFHVPKFLKSVAFVTGTRLVVWGFFKKIVIADRLHDFVAPVFSHPSLYNGLTLFIIAFFFVVQVYCDFSGYSDIAKGIAAYFGYELMINFRRPLLSKSIHGFWKRNHISMTTWFRDYVYISLGGNKVTAPRWLLNIFLTFLISGLWHGASWTFVVWGALYGIIFLIEIPILKITANKKWIAFPAWIYLMLAHILIMIAFRASTFADMQVFYSKIFSFNWNAHQTYQELCGIADLFPLLISIFMIVFLFLKEMHEEFKLLNKIPRYEIFFRPVFYVLLFVAIFTIGEFNSNEFIYFHF
jgi:D-alanyl-lipoteichoic acid acyltransferase DltB (MBOAT superfamily)